MANDERETRMHGNPEMRGGAESHRDSGLSDWGRDMQRGRGDTGYGNPPRFDQHGGQTGQGWHSAGSGGMRQDVGSMGGSDAGSDRYGQEWRGAGYGYQGGGFGHESRHFDQGMDRGDHSSRFDRGHMGGSEHRHQAGGFDQQRYGQQGLGSWGGHDEHEHAYRNWRDQQMQAFDREYEEFRRHRQERFNADFDEWRKSRGGPGSMEASSHAPGARISTTQRPVGEDENR